MAQINQAKEKFSRNWASGVCEALAPEVRTCPVDIKPKANEVAEKWEAGFKKFLGLV